MSIPIKFHSYSILFLCTFAIHALAQGTVQPDLSGNDPHWIKISRQNCWMHNPNPKPGESVDWNGACSNRLASGSGTAIWHNSAENIESTTSGTQVNGSFKGKAIQDADVQGGAHVHFDVVLVHEKPNGFGSYEVDRNGRPSFRYTGNWVNGLMSGQGHGTYYDTDGKVVQDFNGIWENGKPSIANYVPATPTPATAAPSVTAGVGSITPDSSSPAVPLAADAQKLGGTQVNAYRRADIQEATEYWHGVASRPYMSTPLVREQYNALRADPDAEGIAAKWAVKAYFQRYCGKDPTDPWAFDPTGTPMAERIKMVKKAIAWDQEMLAQLTGPSPPHPRYITADMIRSAITSNEWWVSSEEKDLQSESNEANVEGQKAKEAKRQADLTRQRHYQNGQP